MQDGRIVYAVSKGLRYKYLLEFAFNFKGRIFVILPGVFYVVDEPNGAKTKRGIGSSPSFTPFISQLPSQIFRSNFNSKS